MNILSDFGLFLLASIHHFSNLSCQYCIALPMIFIILHPVRQLVRRSALTMAEAFATVDHRTLHRVCLPRQNNVKAGTSAVIGLRFTAPGRNRVS
jgi:hypothetical protein